MKNLVLTLVIIIGTLTAAQAQETTRDANGNWTLLSKTEQAAHDSTTAFTAKITKDREEPVYKGKKGGFYVARVSKKSGKYYRKYLKKD